MKKKILKNKRVNTCRLCGGNLINIFSKKILWKYNVKYYTCRDCLSLQTEFPYWLNEAYAQSNLSCLDTGVVQRTLSNFAAVFLITKILGARNVLDVGGGDGLLCRLLRDYKINCYVKDKYASPKYAQGFVHQDFVPDLITAFEVLEHYPFPAKDLKDLFFLRPETLLLSTEIYDGKYRDWWYLSPESGQHIFFYSREAIKFISNKYKYKYTICGDLIVFTKNFSFFKRLFLKLLLRRRLLHFVKCFILLKSTPGVQEDFLLQTKKSKK